MPTTGECNPELTVQGVRTKLGFAPSSVSSPPADPTEQLEILSHSYSLDIEYVDTSGIRGTEAEPDERNVEMSRMVNGGFVCNPTALDVERWLPPIMGGALGSATAGLKTVLMAESRPCFDVFMLADGLGYKYRQNRVMSTTFAGIERQPMTMSVQTVGVDRDEPPAAYSWPAITYPTGKPFIFPNLIITINSVAYNIYRYSLNFRYAIDTQFMNSFTPTAFPSAQRQVTLQIQFPYKAKPVLFPLYRTGAQPCVLTMDFGATTARRTLIWTIAKSTPVALSEPGVPGKPSIPWDLSLKAVYDSTGSPNNQIIAGIRSAGE